MKFYVCNKCSAGFSDLAGRAVFEKAGMLEVGESRCSCGGVYELIDQKDVVGHDGVFDTFLRRASGAKPS